MLIATSVVSSAKINIGRVQIDGLKKNIEGQRIEQFLGIQYATREGNKKFGKPVVVSYTDSQPLKIDATKPGFICPGNQGFNVPENYSQLKTFIENLMDVGDAKPDSGKCQTLDIYRPADRAPNSLLPIVLYVHGGGLTSGSRYMNMSRGENLFRHKQFKDVILVTIEYSLGPWGFWYSSDDEANVAIHEVIAALKWVQAYGKHFGGDIENVTVVGHSAGASLSHYVQLGLSKDNLENFNLEKSPFQKMILMSGTTSLFPPVTPEVALNRQRAVLLKTRCAKFVNDPNLSLELNECINQLPDNEILAAADIANAYWSPVIDQKLVLSKIEDHITNDHFLSCDMLFTFTKNDASLFTIKHKEHIEENGMNFWTYFGHNELVAQFMEQYPGNHDYNSITKSATDVAFVRGAMQASDLYKKKNLKTQVHEFDFKVDLSLLKNGYGLLSWAFKAFESQSNEIRTNLETLGVFHGMDQLLLFDAPLLKLGFTSIYPSGLVSNSEKILKPIHDFITKGTAKTKCKYMCADNLCTVVFKVCIKTVVSHFYNVDLFEAVTNDEIHFSLNALNGDANGHIENTKVIREKKTKKRKLVELNEDDAQGYNINNNDKNSNEDDDDDFGFEHMERTRKISIKSKEI